MDEQTVRMHIALTTAAAVTVATVALCTAILTGSSLLQVLIELCCNIRAVTLAVLVPLGVFGGGCVLAMVQIRRHPATIIIPPRPAAAVAAAAAAPDSNNCSSQGVSSAHNSSTADSGRSWTSSSVLHQRYVGCLS
jgi:hypothetical protein